MDSRIKIPKEAMSKAVLTPAAIRGNISTDIMALQIMIAQATNIARAGRYSEAERLLLDCSQKGGESSAILDLLARISAQQGRLAEAEACWIRASQLNPGDQAIQAGLRRIRQTNRKSLWLHLIFPFGILITAACVIVLGRLWKSEIQQFRADFRMEWNTYLRNQEARLTWGNKEKDFSLPVEMDGISLRKAKNDLIVTFQYGLFDRGDQLKPEAERLLTTFGKKLEPFIGQILIKIIGQTDDVPVLAGSWIQDNIHLGLLRAIAVAEHLRATTQLPSIQLSTASYGEAFAPFANDSPSNRARNRTVVIQLTSVKK